MFFVGLFQAGVRFWTGRAVGNQSVWVFVAITSVTGGNYHYLLVAATSCAHKWQKRTKKTPNGFSFFPCDLDSGFGFNSKLELRSLNIFCLFLAVHRQLNRWPCHSLTHWSLTDHWATFDFWHYSLIASSGTAEYQGCHCRPGVQFQFFFKVFPSSKLLFSRFFKVFYQMIDSFTNYRG